MHNSNFSNILSDPYCWVIVENESMLILFSRVGNCSCATVPQQRNKEQGFHMNGSLILFKEKSQLKQQVNIAFNKLIYRESAKKTSSY